MERGAPFN